jgi:hypothetical protein
MANYQQRHYLRLDDATEAALEQVCHHSFVSKSAMMRRYVQQGVARDAQNFADEAEKLMKNTSVLRAVGFE